MHVSFDTHEPSHDKTTSITLLEGLSAGETTTTTTTGTSYFCKTLYQISQFILEQPPLN